MVGSRPCAERFLSENSDFPLSSKTSLLSLLIIVDTSSQGLSSLKTAKAVNEDPACLYVGSHRRSNQPNLKNRRLQNVISAAPMYCNILHNIIS